MNKSCKQPIHVKPTQVDEAQQMKNLLGPPVIAADLLADSADNTVKVEYLEDASKELQISIPVWPTLAPSGFTDSLTVKHVASDLVILEGDYSRDDSGAFPLPVILTIAQTQGWADGDNIFSYEILTYNGNTTYSEDLVLKFDRVPPYRNTAPVPFPIIPDITDANINTVKLQLPQYDDWAAQDEVYWFWLNQVPDDPYSVPPDGMEVVVGATWPQDIAVPADTIRALGDGGIFAVYVLKDKAGNYSRLAYQEVGVAIGALPTNLKDPVVPSAADGSVDQLDVYRGVTVEVHEFDNYKATDQVRIIWGTIAMEWREMGSTVSFPLVFSVEPKIIWDQYGASSTGLVPVTVAYEVRRGTVPQGSKDKEIQVNLERIGPVDPGPDPDPEWPDPANPRLPKPEIYGVISDTLNELLPEDEFEDALLRLSIDVSLEEDDVVRFFWGAEHIDMDYTLIADDIGEDLEFEVPWVAIKAGGNGLVDVHYTVTRPGNPNATQSAAVPVDVTAIGIHPEAPEFLGGNTSAPIGWLTCAALYDDDDPNPLDPAIRVQIPDLAVNGLVVGDDVTLTWTALSGLTGDTSIDDAQKIETIKLTAENLNGFVWRVQPYVDHILPIYAFDGITFDGRGKVYYAFTINGKDYESEDVTEIVSMHNAAGSCPLRP